MVRFGSVQPETAVTVATTAVSLDGCTAVYRRGSPARVPWCYYAAESVSVVDTAVTWPSACVSVSHACLNPSTYNTPWFLWNVPCM